jgi:hypothetical protein
MVRQTAIGSSTSKEVNFILNEDDNYERQTKECLETYNIKNGSYSVFYNHGLQMFGHLDGSMNATGPGGELLTCSTEGDIEYDDGQNAIVSLSPDGNYEITNTQTGISECKDHKGQCTHSSAAGEPCSCTFLSEESFSDKEGNHFSYHTDGSYEIQYANGDFETVDTEGNFSFISSDGSYTESYETNSSYVFTHADGHTEEYDTEGNYNWTSSDGSSGSFNKDGSGHYHDGQGNSSEWDGLGNGCYTSRDGTFEIYSNQGSTEHRIIDHS